MTASRYPYATFLDIKFQPLTVIDTPQFVSACKDQDRRGRALIIDL